LSWDRCSAVWGSEVILLERSGRFLSHGYEPDPRRDPGWGGNSPRHRRRGPARGVRRRLPGVDGCTTTELGGCWFATGTAAQHGRYRHRAERSHPGAAGRGEGRYDAADRGPPHLSCRGGHRERDRLPDGDARGEPQRQDRGPQCPLRRGVAPRGPSRLADCYVTEYSGYARGSG